MFEIDWNEGDLEAVQKVLERGGRWARGPEIKEFEEEIAGYVGREYAVAFNSGTSALHALMLAHNIKGGEVIIPSFTFKATADTIVLAGGQPVFADIEEETLGLDARSVREKINENTRAVVVVHYGGCPARDTREIREVCVEEGILLIEDAAESLGGGIGGRKAGCFGDSGMYSLCQNKTVTCGEGGVAVTDSPETVRELRRVRSHGSGYNHRMPSMLAALASSQLSRIKGLIKKRVEAAGRYSEGFKETDLVSTPNVPEGFTHTFQMYAVRLASPGLRDGLQSFLGDRGIASKVYFTPLHLLEEYGSASLPVSESAGGRVLSLPIHPNLTRRAQDLVVEAVNEYVEGF